MGGLKKILPALGGQDKQPGSWLITITQLLISIREPWLNRAKLHGWYLPFRKRKRTRRVFVKSCPEYNQGGIARAKCDGDFLCCQSDRSGHPNVQRGTE